MLEEELRKETKKWLEKLEKEKTKPLNAAGKGAEDNILAYVKDSRHFLEKNDLIRAFEAVLWAWALLEIHRELKNLS